MPPRPTVSVDAALSLIRAYVRYRGWSVYRFAKEAKIARSGIRRLNDPAWNPGTKTLRKLGAAVPANFDPTKAPPPERTPSWPEDANQPPQVEAPRRTGI